jgi:hypothetical protein
LLPPLLVSRHGCSSDDERYTCDQREVRIVRLIQGFSRPDILRVEKDISDIAQVFEARDIFSLPVHISALYAAAKKIFSIRDKCGSVRLITGF